MTPIARDGLAPARWLDTRALTDATRCPACAVPLSGRRCPECRLDVSGPGGRELWNLSQEAATVLGKRSEVIARMRVAAGAAAGVAGAAAAKQASEATAGPTAANQAAAANRAPYSRPGTPAVPGQPAPASMWPPAGALPGGLQPGAFQPAPRLAAPARSGWALQTILQVLGAILLAGAGLVFTVFAWGNLSLLARGAILVAITAAVFVGARRAAHASLRSAAEVIAALGAVLVVLDAWVLWTATVGGGVGSGAGGAGGGSSDAVTAFAAALFVSAVVLVPLGRWLALATASVVGLVCLTLAPAVLATTTSSAPGAAYLLVLSAALCLYGPRLLGPQLQGAQTHGPQPLGPDSHDPSSHDPAGTAPGVGPVTRRHALAVIAVLAPLYVAAAAMVTLVVALHALTAEAVGPLVAIAVVSGLWATAQGSSSGAWSATTGCAVVLAGTVGAAAVLTTSALTYLWCLPLGAVVGFAATVGVLRAVPRLGAPAARAGWVVVLVIGALPALALTVMTMNVLGSLTLLRDPDVGINVLHALAGLVVLAAARPLLHPLGTQRVITRTPAAPASAAAAPVSPAPATPAFHTTAGPIGPLPQRPGVLVDHPLGVSLVASTLLLLGLPLLLPGAAWTVTTLLVLAVVVALARTPLTDWVRGLSAALASPSDPVRPISFAHDQIAALVRGCVYTFCTVAVVVAAVLSFALATGADPAVSRDGGATLVATTFVVAGLLLWVARGWVPGADIHRVSNRAALAFASMVIASVGLGVLTRVVVPLDSIGWYAAPFPLVAALVTRGVRDLRGARAVRAALPGTTDPRPHDLAAGTGRRIDADHLAALGAAVALCAPGLVVSANIALTASLPAADPGQSLAVALVATALLATTVVLTWQLGFAAATPTYRWLRAMAGALVPVTGVLTLLSLRSVALATDLDLARLDWPLAVLGLLVLVLTWAGAATSGAARRGCEGAVVVLAAVAVLAVVNQGDPARIAIALSICAVGSLAYAVAAGRPQYGWLALGLGVSASWVSMSGSGLPLEVYTAPGGVVVVATGVWQLVRSLRGGAPTDRTAHAVQLVLGGLTVLVLPSVLLTPGAGEHGRGVVVLVGVLWLGATARLLLATAATVAARLRPLVTGMTVLALVGASVGLGGHAVALAARAVAGPGVSGQATSGPGLTTGVAPGLATGLWTAAAVLVTAALAVQLERVRFPRSGPVDPRLSVLVGDPRAWAVTVCTVLLTAPVTVLLSGGWFTSASAWVAAALVAVWGGAALLGTPPGLPRVRSSHEFALRAVPALIGAYVTALLGTVAAAPSGPGTGGGPLVELVTLAGIVVAVVTVRAAQVVPTSSTWTTVVFGAVATLVPLTLEMVVEPTGGRITAAMITAAAWLVLGVRLRWQAPVACGAVALLVQVVVLAGPPALAAMSGMLGWMVLAAVGGTLLALGLTYERQITSARKVLRHYSELR